MKLLLFVLFFINNCSLADFIDYGHISNVDESIKGRFLSRSFCKIRPNLKTSTVVGRINPGEELLFDKIQDDFVRVFLKKGFSGWVPLSCGFAFADRLAESNRFSNSNVSYGSLEFDITESDDLLLKTCGLWGSDVESSNIFNFLHESPEIKIISRVTRKSYVDLEKSVNDFWLTSNLFRDFFCAAPEKKLDNTFIFYPRLQQALNKGWISLNSKKCLSGSIGVSYLNEKGGESDACIFPVEGLGSIILISPILKPKTCKLFSKEDNTVIAISKNTLALNLSNDGSKVDDCDSGGFLKRAIDSVSIDRR